MFEEFFDFKNPFIDVPHSNVARVINLVLHLFMCFVLK